MARYITIDGGTTNTRVYLVSEGKIVDAIKLSIGVKENIDGNDKYKQEIKAAIQTILKENYLSEKDIDRILCSGMITSDLGLWMLPHLTLPCGIKEMSEGTETMEFPEISSVPFVLIRGLKTAGDSLEDADMMRGEETELMGLCEKLEEDCLYVLPGSHCKLIQTNGSGKITGFSTLLTGEMIEAISRHTILSGSMDIKSASLDKNFLEKGYKYTKTHGINSALFKVRTMRVIFGATADEAYSFFMGVMLHGEVESIINSGTKKVVIGGKKALKEPLSILLNLHCNKDIVSVPDEITDVASVYGAVRIYEH